ncbi:MMPL family transporter [Peribacillus butanolivorans]|uniref:MMPL family transporter n=1 Tax=Peribacillus butanolivorans TaxID=421767 RepID=UPI0039FCA332
MDETLLGRLSRMMTGKVSRWVVIAVWIIVATILTITLPDVKDRTSNNTADLPADSASVVADKLIKKEFPNSSGIPALLTWHREGGLTEADLAEVQYLSKELTENPLTQQSFLPPLHEIPLPALQGSVSEDGTTFVQPLFFKENTETAVLEKNLKIINRIVTERVGLDPFKVQTNTEKLSLRVTGPVGISVDATGLFSGADFQLLLATVILVLVVLLIIYRSPLLAIIPLIGVGFAYLVTSPILGFMADHDWITVDSQAISIMTVLLFGAGTDYCLFLISHYRSELRHHESKREAMIAAFKDSSGAIAMSGLTIVISLLTLLVAKYGAYHRFAVPFSLSILIMMLAALTLVPALLSVFGRASFFPIVPRTPEMEESRAKKKGKTVKKHKEAGRIGNWIGNIVTTKPWTVILTCLIIFSVLAGYSSQIKYSYDILSSFPEDMNSREGYKVISDSYTPGELAPATVVVDTDGKDIDLADVLKKMNLIESVTDPINSKSNKDLQSYEVTFNINPYDIEAINSIPDIRSLAEKELKAANISAVDEKVWIGGQTATQFDKRDTVKTDEFMITPIIIVLISLLLLAYLRSVTAMIYLMGTVILSFFAAMGLGWIILHYFMGVEAIEGTIPLYSFVFLVALGEDYNIFMVSSIWRKKKTMPIKQAIREGVAETSGVITSAGIILAATFSVLATLPIQVLVQFGLITALGVLMDTFIVRPFLVPAITALLGRSAFWPSKVAIHKEKERAQ